MDWWWKKKNNKKQILERGAKQILTRGAMLLEDLIECCDGKSNPIKFFSAHEILKATNNFSYSNRVSELFDFVCVWYSCKNENHHKILISRFKFVEGNFCRNIAVSSMVSGHKNFLKLVGCCLEFEDPVLVYHGVKKHYKLNISEQPWKRRVKIAEDIATALAYLHTAFPRPFVYRSMSLWNILLDEDGIAKLTDFSDCLLIPKGETFVQVDSPLALSGYMDPKYMMSGVVSEETDVFAFGILLKTLLAGKINFLELQEESKEECEGDDDSEINVERRYVPHWSFNLLEERRIYEIADPKMLEKMGEISEEELCQMKAFLMLSLRCVDHNGEVLTMVEVAKELKKIQRSLKNDSSSPSRETQFDSIPKSFLSQSSSQIRLKNTKALLS